MATVAAVAAAEATITASVALSMRVEDDTDRVVVPVPVEGTTTICDVGAVGGEGIGRPRGIGTEVVARTYSVSLTTKK